MARGIPRKGLKRPAIYTQTRTTPMLKQLTQFKSVINGIENYFHFDCNCPVNIAKEALFEALKWIGQIEDAAKAAQAEQDAANAPPENAMSEEIQQVPEQEIPQE